MASFNGLAHLADELAAEGSRLKKRAAIAVAIQSVAVDVTDAGLFCLYLAGQPFAEADMRKLNAGGALLTRALKQVSGCTDAALTAAYRRHGDLGSAAFDLLVAPYGQAPVDSTLSLVDLKEAFATMAAARTTAVRFATVEGLLRRATALETKYLLKLMLGDMRIGVKQSLIEEAIAVASGTDAAAVRHAVMLEADLSRAVARAFDGTLGEARMKLFHPLGFMLASPVETPEEAMERFTEKPPKAVKEPKAKKPRKKKGVVSGEDAAEVFADMSELEAVTPNESAEEGFAEDVASASLAVGATLAVANTGVSPLRKTIEPSRFGRDDSGSGDEGSAGFGSDDSGLGGDGSALPIQAFLEDKYDGMRAQLHCGDATQPGRVAIYSRNREDITESFPELVEAFRNVAGPIILDGEILGWDLAVDKALPFAIMGQRIGRKRIDNALRRQIPVRFMAFDLLFEAGELLLPLPLRERRARLQALAAKLMPVTTAPLDEDVHGSTATAQGGLFAPEPTASTEPEIQRLLLSAAKLVESAAAIDQAYADARARANEGVMLKAAGSAYLPGRRGLAWVKLKRELATLDVVITGAEFGSGRRAQSLSDYTFAVRGPDGNLLNVGKAYSGVTDAEIAELTEWLKAHTLEDHGHFRTVEPLRVLEVAFNNIMRSERHASGFAMRFPRIIRVRDDKPVEEIDTLARVEEIYQSQPDRPAEDAQG